MNIENQVGELVHDVMFDEKQFEDKWQRALKDAFLPLIEFDYELDHHGNLFTHSPIGGEKIYVGLSHFENLIQLLATAHGVQIGEFHIGIIVQMVKWYFEVCVSKEPIVK